MSKKIVTQSLRKLSEQFIEVQNLIDSGEVSNDVISSTLESIDMMFEKKIEQVAEVKKDLDLSKDKVSSEIKRLQAREKALKNKSEFLNEYMIAQMKAVGKPKLKGDFLSMTLPKQKDVLEIIDESLIDDEYIEGKYVTTVKKSELLAALKNELELDESERTIKGASIGKSKQSLRIY